jgi:hypothetical protein
MPTGGSKHQGQDETLENEAHTAATHQVNSMAENWSSIDLVYNKGCISNLDLPQIPGRILVHLECFGTIFTLKNKGH